MIQDDDQDKPTWRPLTPEEQEAIKKAYRPYEGWPSITVIYNKPAEQKIPAKEVLRQFDERRKTEPRLELKQFCEELGVKYGSVRVAKSRIAKEKRKRPRKKK